MPRRCDTSTLTSLRSPRSARPALSSVAPEHAMRAYASSDRSLSPPLVHVPRDYNAAVDFVDRHLVEGRGEKLAFIDDTTRLTYAGLAELVNRAGDALRALGVGQEDRVLLVLLDTVRFPALFFGAMKIGAVPVPVNTLLTAE